MGGIAEETGSMTCSIALDRPAATVLLRPRTDGQLQIFSFDELDAHRPFTLCMPMRAFASTSESALQASMAEPGRTWAWSVVGALWQLQSSGLLDARKVSDGLNVALLHTLPMRVGLAANASLAAASVAALLDHFAPSPAVVGSELNDAVSRARIGQSAERSMLGRAASLGRHVAAATSSAMGITRWQSDTDAALPPIAVPVGMRLVAIDTNVSKAATSERLRSACVAATMAHSLILKKMRDMGIAAGRTLVADPMGGFLSRLDSNDYKRWFRPYLPETLSGSEYRAILGDERPAGIEIEEKFEYPVRGVADHHVLDALRVRNFARFIEQANQLPIDAPTRGVALDKAGHLMYASHQSLSGDAALGVPQADQLVRLVRQREREGLYGARLTASGRGGVVAVLCEDNERATTALADVLATYAEETGLVPTSLRTATAGTRVAGSEETKIL